MNKQIKRSMVAWTAIRLGLLSSPALADEPNPVHLSTVAEPGVRYEFREPQPADIERMQFARGIQVRGWQVSRRVYFGQAKVGNCWGVGFVVTDGNIVYGFNNRGIEVTRYF